MGFLDSIEKLINEHGSATILKERIQLANDKYSVLEDKVSILQHENSILKEQNADLKSQLDKATQEINRLNEIFNTIQENKSIKKYDEVTQNILKVFFDVNDDVSINDIVRFMPLNASVIQYHFDLLQENKLIIQSKLAINSSWSRENEPAKYKITPAGRKYIIENKIE